MSESSADLLSRFVFDQLDARGCIVSLSETCEAIQATHHYPPGLAAVLNQFAVAACLLRDSIKVPGAVTVQLRSEGALSLIMADCSTDSKVRAIAEYDAHTLPANTEFRFDTLPAGSVLAITITPQEGERYQGIVPIEFPTLEECLADYFVRSEQLPTAFKLLADRDRAVGIALHSLPAQLVVDAQQSKENFSRLQHLLNTLGLEEARELTIEEILTRLFHEENCRVFEARELAFGCHCSADRSLDAIVSLGAQDVQDLLTEQRAEGKQELVVDCHFCFQRYVFDLDSIEKMVTSAN